MIKVLLTAPYGGIVGGISRWTGHIIDFYKSTSPGDCSLDIASTARHRHVSTNMSILKRCYLGLMEYGNIFKGYKQKLLSGQYDVMHLTTSGGLSFVKDPLFLRAAKKKGAKTVVHIRFGRIPQLVARRNWEYRLMAHTFRMADKVVAIDRSTLEALKADGFTNVCLLPNPLTPKVTEVIRTVGDVSREPRTILFAGHVLKTKGIFELLEACSTIDNIKLKIVGHITDAMHNEITSIYGSDHKWFEILDEKPYEDVIREMMTCDIFVLPTYTEGFPNVILEAMATGCAIISTPVGAIPEMLEPEKDGTPAALLVPPQNAGELNHAISRLIEDENLKESMRTTVSKRALERYSLPKVWSQMLDIWKSVI